MEFTHGRRDGLYNTDQEEEQVEVSKHPPSVPSPSSPSSSSTAFRWHDGSSGSGGSDGIGGGNNSFVVKEHMFDKVVTPSDVGKLNRLVIPKQHAEKYLPLDMSANEKGLLLGFEDRAGKLWRFRYCYWNSSHSYVMTKGWSRFVKEKGLDAGDTVFFGRGVGEAGRHHLYIDWKRRPENRDPPRIPPLGLPLARSVGPWSGRLLVPPAVACGHNWQAGTYSAVSSGTGGQLLCFRLPVERPPQMKVQQVGSSGLPMVLNSVPLVHDQAAAKRVRLFGVNLDCPESEGDAKYCNSGTLSVSVPQLHPRTALPLLRPPCVVGEKLAGSSSSSMSKEQHSPPDLYLCGRRIGS